MATTPMEDFMQFQLNFTTYAVAHMARCMGNAGILDDNARKSMRAHINVLQKAFERVAAANPKDDPAIADLQFLVDYLVGLLPPPAPNG